MIMFEPEAMKCPNCGANINRRSLRCDYCGTEYKHPNEQIKIIVDRPGVHTIRTQTRVSLEHMRQAPERAREYVLRDMREQIADGLLAYMKMTTSESYDPLNLCQIIRGEVRVVDPSFDY
jgi:predicted amidophosphoribosyltransferase